MEDSDEAAERLEKDYRQMTRRLEEISVKLTHAREEAARRFERAIVEQLHDLGMKNARLSMAFAPLAEGEKLRDRFSAQGVDRIEMMFCANLGQPLKPLARSFRRRAVAHHAGAQKSFGAEAGNSPKHGL